MPNTISLVVDGGLSPALRRLGNTVLLSEEEIEFFEGIQKNVASFDRGVSLLNQGDEFKCSYIVQSGWLCSHRSTLSGRRQIVSIYLPGDFIGLHVNFTRKSILTYEALTPVETALIEPMRIIEIHQRFPILASGLDWASVRHQNILSEHNISMGARSAEESLLHLLLELWCRLMLIGEAGDDGFKMQLSQEQIGNVIGLSLVHTNKTIKKLKADGLIAVTGRRHYSFPDIREAIRRADFDATFLEAFRTTSLVVQHDNPTDAQIAQIIEMSASLAQEGAAQTSP